MKTLDTLITTPPDREIVSTRVFNVNREIMFRAWTDPVHLANWWGPNGFTNTFNEFDLREGGRWSFVMHGPDKGNYPNESVFTKIDEPKLLAWHHVSEPEFYIVTTFDDLTGDSTRVTFRMIFNTEEECNKLRSFVPEKNEENFDRLETVLLKMTGK